MAQETPFTVASEYWIPEFGLFDAQNIDPERVYQGRIYRLTVEHIKAITESLGFTASLEATNLRDAFVDMMRNDSRITLMLERNTKPTDLNLRYMRDRWETVETPSKEHDPMRPWVKACFLTRFLPDKVYAVLASQLRLAQEDFPHFYIRVNLKDRTAGLIAESQFLDKFPTGAFEVFAIPENQVPVIPTVTVPAAAPASTTESAGAQAAAQTPTTATGQSQMTVPQTPSAQTPIGQAAASQSQPPLQTFARSSESSTKYATYSKSETDRMLKQQSESIVNALGLKISGQQRIFQEAIEKQEKAFTSLLERLTISADDTAGKLKSYAESSKETQSATLQQFQKELSQQLEQFRAAVNKSILPVGKQLEEKIQAIQIATKSQKPKKEKSVLPVIILLLLIATAAGVGYTCFSLSGFKLPVKQLGTP